MNAAGTPRQPQMRLKAPKPSSRVQLRGGESHVEDGRRPAKLSDRLLVERGHVRADDDTGWKGESAVCVRMWRWAIHGGRVKRSNTTNRGVHDRRT